MTNGRVATALLASALMLLVVACGDEDDGEEMDWSADITSAESTLHNVNADGETVYGWNRLVGETQIGGETVQVEMLGNVAYDSGSGPFFGFVTLTFPGDTLLSLRMDGETEASADTSRAQFQADLTVLGGTGRFSSAMGDGEWEGFRDAALGGAVHMDVELEIELAGE